MKSLAIREGSQNRKKVPLSKSKMAILSTLLFFVLDNILVLNTSHQALSDCQLKICKTKNKFLKSRKFSRKTRFPGTVLNGSTSVIARKKGLVQGVIILLTYVTRKAWEPRNRHP